MADNRTMDQRAYDNTAKARSKAEPEPDYDAKQDVYEDSLADEPMAAETPPASRTKHFSEGADPLHSVLNDVKAATGINGAPSYAVRKSRGEVE